MGYQKSKEDGEETIFNMVNGFCGNLCLSGHIEVADVLNMNLIQEGISLYKRERDHIHNSYPVWLAGFTRINDKNTWAVLGLVNEDNSRMLIAVWRLGSSEDYIELPIYRWNGKAMDVRQIYPDKRHNVRFYFNKYKGTITVHLPETYQARLFEVVA